MQVGRGFIEFSEMEYHDSISYILYYYVSELVVPYYSRRPLK